MTNDYSVVHDSVVHDASCSRNVSIAMGFMLGALVGAGVALLLAPASGEETRGRLTDAGRRVGGAARDTVDRARETVDRVRDTVSDLRHDVGAKLTT